jgi:hypothetical protein
MAKHKGLFKTTIVIWSEYDPGESNVELEDFARDACTGESYCSVMETDWVKNPPEDKDWEDTEFFQSEDE